MIRRTMRLEDEDSFSQLYELEEARNRKKARERTIRIAIAIGVMSISFGSIALISAIQLAQLFATSAEQERQLYREITLMGGVLVVAGIFSGMFLYLQTGFKRSSEFEGISVSSVNPASSNQELAGPSLEEVGAMLKTALTPLQDELKILRDLSGNIEEHARDDLIEKLRKRVSQDAAASIIVELEVKAASDAKKDVSERDFQERIHETRMRLLDEAKALQLRGNINLLFGGIVTVAALYVLWTVVSLTLNQSGIKWSEDPWSLVVHFGPRLTLALFLQIFAYFFLRLYKSSLSEIKYYQNELTNIETKRLALNVALRKDGADLLKEVVTNLLATERNHILTKDQTTVELEKARLEKDQTSKLLKVLPSLLSKKD